jgi:uncharacterized protein YhbP (UPF0306 family)
LKDTKSLEKFLDSHILMSVATFGEYPWPAIVYYVRDNAFNLYYMSDPGTIHSKNIKDNPKVACAIYDSTQLYEYEKVGVQLYGEVSELNILEKVRWVLKLWNKLIAVKKDLKVDIDDFIRLGKSKMYKVTPKKIKFFNTKEYPDTEYKVWDL